MLKDFFNKGKCALGFHAEAWRYLRARACQQASICPHCQAQSERVLHQWSGWQLAAADRCEMLRYCDRCQEGETKVEHEWALPRYTATDSCEQVRPCSRCGEQKADRTLHVWGSWAYEAEGSCSQRATCVRCAAEGNAHRISHAWTPWQQSDFYEAPVRVCGRCAEMVFDTGDPVDADTPISMQSVERAIAHAMGSPTTAVLGERIAANRRELLSPVTPRYVRFAIERRAKDEPTKEVLLQLTELLERCRHEGIDAVFTPPAAAVSAAPTPSRTPSSQAHGRATLDTRLCGQWLHTEAMSSGGYSLVIDTHLVLDTTGRFAWWSESAGVMGTRQSAPEPGVWSAVEGVLRLAFDDGNGRLMPYVVEGDSMLCPNETRYRLWKRVG